MPLVMLVNAAAFAASLGVFSPSTLFGWGGAGLALIGIWFSAKAHAKQKTGEVWEQTAGGWQAEAAAMKERADRFETDAKEQRELKHAALAELAAARMKTDMTAVLTQMADQHAAVMETLSSSQTESVAAVAAALQTTEERIVQQFRLVTETQATTTRSLGLIEKRLQRVEDRVPPGAAG